MADVIKGATRSCYVTKPENIMFLIWRRSHDEECQLFIELFSCNRLTFRKFAQASLSFCFGSPVFCFLVISRVTSSISRLCFARDQRVIATCSHLRRSHENSFQKSCPQQNKQPFSAWHWRSTQQLTVA